MRKLAILGFALAFAVTGLAASDILILGTTDRITELSFANSYDHFTWHILRHTTQGLLRLEPGTTAIKPGIAESWEISEDGLVYTFHLRPGVVFWDGTPCDANSVKWALERTLRLNGPEGGVGLIKPVIKSIDVLDDLTVQITLNYPDRTFLIRMTDNVIPSLIYTGAPENDFAKGNYVGLGPYRIVEYVPDERVVLEAVDTYFGEPPKTTARLARETARHNLQTCCFDDTPGVCDNLETLIEKDDIILVKGSRTARLERVVDRLHELFAGAAGPHRMQKLPTSPERR